MEHLYKYKEYLQDLPHFLNISEYLYLFII